jgi:hypothetical protein
MGCSPHRVCWGESRDRRRFGEKSFLFNGGGAHREDRWALDSLLNGICANRGAFPGRGFDVNLPPFTPSPHDGLIVFPFPSIMRCQKGPAGIMNLQTVAPSSCRVISLSPAWLCRAGDFGERLWRHGQPVRFSVNRSNA